MSVSVMVAFVSAGILLITLAVIVIAFMGEKKK